MTKNCTKCGRRLPLNEFYRDISHEDGRGSACKKCKRADSAKYRNENRDKVVASNARYRENNRTQIRARDVQRCRENRAARREWAAGYYNKNSDMVKAAVARYREANRAVLAERSRAWREANPEKVAAHSEFRRAVRAGEIEQGPCSVCGRTGAVDAHHDDYSKPLDVMWLCRKHHRRLHSGASA